MKKQNQRLMTRRLGASLIALSLFGASACGSDAETFTPRETENNFKSSKRGEECGAASDCVGGLVCTEESVCDYAGDKEEGAGCEVSLECGEGLFCDMISASCATAGDKPADALCETSADCAPGLQCQPRGLSAQCQPVGEGAQGEACSSSADCLGGLGCAIAPGSDAATCTPGALGLPTPFAGVDCSASAEDDGPARFFFEVPGEEPLGEFFRLPFPNDIRLENGRPTLDGFPTPGEGVLGFDIVQTYVDAIERDQDRWGHNQAVFLRSSKVLDFETLRSNDDDATEDVDERNLYLVNISPDSPAYGAKHSIFWEAKGGTGSQRSYICQNWISVRPFWGRPLLPETTYAVVVGAGVKDSDGALLEQDPDFAALLSGSAPSDSRLTKAHEAYAPLRAWATDQGIEEQDLLVASVFTTGDPFAQTSKLRDVVRAHDVTASALTACDDGVASPCGDGLEGEEHARGCFGAREGFTEIHGKLSLPILQRGDAPYLEEGGAIGSTPTIVRSEDVCVAMTVPDTPMPEQGYPILIYAHGTGGQFTNQVTRIAPLVSNVTLPDGSTTGMITIGWDQVQHATRRGGSELDPEPLVFNWSNPSAARGNFMQGGADVYALVKYVEGLELSEQDSPTGSAFKVDPTQIYFMGHSQGGTTGPIAIPFEPNLRASVLSGAGAGLILGLLGKTSPVNSPEALQIALQDPRVTESHPVLNLLQGYFEPVDPVNYAPYIGQREIEGLTRGSHLFHVFGVGDTFTPPNGLKAMARALYSAYIGPIFDDFKGGVSIRDDEAVSGNRQVGDTRYTVVGRQYDPKSEYDGHFVIFRDDLAQRDFLQFLTTAIGDERPSLGENP